MSGNSVSDVRLFQELRALLRRIPIARMRDDYSGLECLGCGAIGTAVCTQDCWVAALERLGDHCEEVCGPWAWIGQLGLSLASFGGRDSREYILRELAEATP